MHPNMITLSKDIINSYFQLEKEFDNCNVLAPQDNTSTYSLIEDSDVVICFCSTVGVESNYMGKKTIGIGGSPYYLLNIVNKVLNGKEAAELICKDKVKAKSKKDSVIWMNYLWYYTQNNPYINSQSQNNKQIFNFNLKSTYLERLLQSPFRLEIELRKPQLFSKATLNRWIRSFGNILFNKYQNNN